MMVVHLSSPLQTRSNGIVLSLIPVNSPPPRFSAILGCSDDSLSPCWGATYFSSEHLQHDNGAN
jgi:hypothetical protein